MEHSRIVSLCRVQNLGRSEGRGALNVLLLFACLFTNGALRVSVQLR